jgi:dTDP-4-amino-4,6-dideoxygalactose transaminase
MRAVRREVPLFDPRRSSAKLESELTAAWTRVLRSGSYVLGEEASAFEREIGAYLGASHAIGVSSGSDALLLAMMLLGIGPGDEVICPTFTFFATAGAIARVGATPVFVDIDPASFTIDVHAVARAISERTRAIVPVHLFGLAADMTALEALAEQSGAALIEDAAQAIGATIGPRRAGTVGALGCFSFFPSKNLGAFGDAGLVTTPSAELAERARRLRQHGAQPKYHHAMVGGNFRIDALQAALLRVKLAHLDEAAAKRRSNADRYRERFRDEASSLGHAVVLPEDAPGHVYNQLVVRVGAHRDALRAHLGERGIQTAIYYPEPLHLQPCFASLGYREGSFPVAEAASRETLALPVFPELEAIEIDYVAESILDYFRRG